MKRSKVIVLTMAVLSLGMTGCRRSGGPEGGGSEILPLSALSPDLRSRIPSYTAGANVSAEKPPLNAYDENLGYYHQPCAAWFPYPYDYHDSRWGYYRCGKWSKYSSATPHRTNYPHRTTSSGVGSSLVSGGNDSGSGTATGGVSSAGGDDGGDYKTQPAGAPVHAGVAHHQASQVRATSISRGGFGSTGRSSSSSSFSSSS